MSESKSLHLTTFMRPASLHCGALWYPGACPDANFNLAHLKSFIQKLEAAKFDAFFMADHLAVLNMPVEALKRSHTVTSFEPFALLCSSSSKNFSRNEHIEHSERYRRAREFYDVVTGLWDSFADDAFIRDHQSGIFFDPEKLHVINHEGDDLKVRGPLNIERPVQEAKAKRLKLDSLVHYDSAIASLSVAFGADTSGFDPDGKLPEDIPETNASKTSRAGVLKPAQEKGLTVRQLAQRYGGYSELAFVGTPETVADELGIWLAEKGADGFTVVFPFLRQGLDDVT